MSDDGQTPPTANSIKASSAKQKPAEVSGLSDLYVPNARPFAFLSTSQHFPRIGPFEVRQERQTCILTWVVITHP